MPGLPKILNNTGCPPLCGIPQVRALTAQLNPSLYSPGGPYVDMTNVKDFMLAFDMTTIPWGRGSAWYFNGPDDETGEYQGLGGCNLPGFSRINDEAAAQYDYQYCRYQVLFSVPTQYILMCGYTAGGSTAGTVDEGCYGTYGGACGVMEIPWSVIPGYNDVWLYLEGPVQPDSTVYYPTIEACRLALWVPPDYTLHPTGPDYSATQDCGGPISVNSPYGQQFEAP